MVDMFKTIVRENGVLGLYRGIFPNFLKVAPAVSISYVVYERVRKELGMTGLLSWIIFQFLCFYEHGFYLKWIKIH